MKKIIDVPNGYSHVIFLMGNEAHQHQGYGAKVKDLSDYDEPRTADGLTLREFLEKANGDLSNVELVNGDIKESFWNGLSGLIIAFIENPEIMKDYRIKPEKKYIPWTKETAPELFEGVYHGNNREFILSFYSHELGWGFMIEEEDYDIYFTFEELYHNFKQKDGTPCGQEVEG